MSIEKNLKEFFGDEPPGNKNNAVRWFQKQVMKKALEMPRDFKTKEEWEKFRSKIRSELPGIIGIPAFAEMKESYVRGKFNIGKDVMCERVDVCADDDYYIPVFVFTPACPPSEPMPALVWNPGWPQTKWDPAYQKFAVRMAKQGYAVVIIDHAPFGETSLYDFNNKKTMINVMGAGNLLGISQLAFRTAETIRVGEYMRARPDVNPSRVAVSGLCQGGMDTWLTAAMDDRFCAAAPICSASTFAVHMAEMASYDANGDTSPFPFGILQLCDIEHLHACIAPRPLLVRSNLPDFWWPVSGYNDVEDLTRKIYRLYDAEDKVDFGFEVHEHNLTGPFADALEEFLLKYV